ncbi:MAG: hypothetical protein ACOX32_07890 [Bacteroidaceae bacterium]|jgi:hypothetical protein
MKKKTIESLIGFLGLTFIVSLILFVIGIIFGANGDFIVLMIGISIISIVLCFTFVEYLDTCSFLYEDEDEDEEDIRDKDKSKGKGK